MKHSYWGPSFDEPELAGSPRRFNGTQDLVDWTAEQIASGKVVGWFQGRMEFGPRALGARSILGDPRSKRMQSVMNLKIKHRESFRPFAPSVLREHASGYFDLDRGSPYMLLVAPIVKERRIAMTEEEDRLFGIEKLNIPRSDIPAVTHVDYSARIQTVDRNDHPLYYDLIEAFRRRTGCPVLVNTSFNVRGEPIVCRPEEAFRCFMRTEMDYLAIGSFLLAKDEQEGIPSNAEWKKEFELD
jgi:carbamoyltransferase